MTAEVKQGFEFSTMILHVPDVETLDSCRDWYTRFGLTPNGDTPGESTWFDIGRGCSLGIHIGGKGSAVVYFNVDDVDQLYQRLTDEGFQFDEAPTTKRWGGRVAYLKDPNGVAVGIVSPVAS